IYIAKSDGSGITQLTNTYDVNEMFPLPLNENSILFSTFEKCEIATADISTNFSGIQLSDTLVKSAQPLVLAKGYTETYIQKSAKAITMISGTAPYVNQVYDTPDWHTGSGSCAPTTAIMAIGYYNRLPCWDIICSWPSSHTSHYGAYVADKYRYNEIYYDTYADAYGTDAYGGYGYMWGNGSPNSYMASYISNHNISSVHSTSTTFQDVLDEIDNSYPFPICNLLSTAGHLTLTVGYVNGQHTLIFNDPYGDKNDGSWPNFYGENAYYDWPGYNNGYENLNTIAWTVTAESSEPAYNDTIIDDVYYSHGFYMHNQDPSHMRYFRDNATGGYNDHFWYTYTSASTTVDTCYVTWTPDLPSTGDYEVSVYIPTSNASATTARYKVYYNGGTQTVIVDQSPIYGEWVSLGTFPFLAGTSGYVKLGDGTGTAGQKIAFDAMKWVRISQPAAVASFNSSATSVCEGNSVQYTNISSNAVNYSWTFSGGTPSTSLQTDPSVVYSVAGSYDVILVAAGSGGSDILTMTNYITVYPLADALFSVNDTLVYLPTANVIFINASLNATSYLWDFGDGTISSDQNPWHSYTIAGDYTISLIAYNVQCGNDTIIMFNYIHVDVSTGINNESSDDDILICPNPAKGNFTISYELKKQKEIEIIMYDILGNEIYFLQKTLQQLGKHEIIVNYEHLHISNGVYFIEITTDDSAFRKKIIYQK
ncbi:MAG: PKD domain-containing protein, partial [Bacteroidota bacterium]